MSEEKEKAALRNVRALVDDLEGQERASRGRQGWWVLIALIPIGLFGAWVAMKQIPAQMDPAARELQACEVNGLVARVAEFERVTRETNPGVPNKEIAKLLDRERPALAAAASAECRNNKGK